MNSCQLGWVGLGPNRELALWLSPHVVKGESNEKEDSIADIELHVVGDLSARAKTTAADIETPILGVTNGDQKDQKGSVKQEKAAGAEQTRNHGSTRNDFDPWQNQGQPCGKWIWQHIKAADVLQELEGIL